jgi:adenylylsulfate kinase-like enzyme|tara:strand:- start:5448 stop:5873 length:426 start_codon:yes stop_codon:yes gene_type:complete
MIYVLYGQPASGKTTIGKKMAEFLKTPFVIDGDEFREMFSNNNYGKDGRERNIRNANAVATYLNKKGKNVVMCLVNPYKYLRKELKDNNQDEVVGVFLQSSRDLRKEYYVEDFEIGDPEYVLTTDAPVEESWCNLKKLLEL